MVKKLFLGLLCTCGVVCGSYAYNNYANNVVNDNVNNVVVANRKNAIQSSDLVVGNVYNLVLEDFVINESDDYLVLSNYSFNSGISVYETLDNTKSQIDLIPYESIDNNLHILENSGNIVCYFIYGDTKLGFTGDDFPYYFSLNVTFTYSSSDFISVSLLPYISGYIEPSIVDNIFDVTEDVIGGFNVVLSDSVTSVQNLFWDVDDGLTTLGTILCIGLGVGLVLWAFRLIKSLIKHRG